MTPAAPATAVFDFDGTLTTGDSLLPFLWRWARRKGRLRPRLTAPLWGALYVCRLVSDAGLKQRLLTNFLAGDPIDEIAAFADEFCRDWLPTRLHPEGNERLRFHQARGDRIILLSASPDLYVPAAARHLGISESLCTRVAAAAGRCTGRIVGDNCKGPAKLERLREHFGDAAPAGPTYAYGDSSSDRPVLEWADHGFLLTASGWSRVREERPG